MIRACHQQVKTSRQPEPDLALSTPPPASPAALGCRLEPPDVVGLCAERKDTIRWAPQGDGQQPLVSHGKLHSILVTYEHCGFESQSAIY